MMKKLIEEILKDKEFQERPPVLIDIGASGGYHKRWMAIAPYSICLAFDADDRKMGYIEKENTIFKKQLTFNSLVYPEHKPEVPFYLTMKPQCSSTLVPDSEALSVWSHAPYFEVVKEVNLPALTINEVLRQSGLDYVDWFKTDSQGIDLSLFKSLPVDIQNRITVIETEPGIIDSYKGEDKLFDVLAYFNKSGFWLAGLKIKGFARMRQDVIENYSTTSIFRRLFFLSQKMSPGWGEMLWFNSWKNSPSRRGLLLGWITAMTEGQFGFAHELAEQGRVLFKEELFNRLSVCAGKQMRRNVLKLKSYPFWLTKIKLMIGITS